MIEILLGIDIASARIRAEGGRSVGWFVKFLEV